MNYKIHPHEKVLYVILLIISLSLYTALGLYVMKQSNPMGLCFSYFLVWLFFSYLAPLFFMGYLKGSAVKITKKQFPDIYTIVKDYSEKLSLKNIPEVYIMEGGGLLNAFATRLAGRNFVVIYSDVLEIAYAQGKDAVSFIIGHELGHIKQNHLGLLKSFLIMPASFVPLLGNAYSRACEYTCDNIGYSLCPQGALKGISVLALGKSLYTHINYDEIYNAYLNLGFWGSWAEKFSTHPYHIKRIVALGKLQRESAKVSDDSSIELIPFISPKISIQAQDNNINRFAPK